MVSFFMRCGQFCVVHFRTLENEKDVSSKCFQMSTALWLSLGLSWRLLFWRSFCLWVLFFLIKQRVALTLLATVSLSFSVSASLRSNSQSECRFLLSSGSVLSRSEASILSVQVNSFFPSVNVGGKLQFLLILVETMSRPMPHSELQLRAVTACRCIRA